MRLMIEHHFDSAHWLPDYDGACGNLHGHTWKVAVIIEGEPNDKGMVVDFREVKQIINVLDHRCLNDIIPNPTAENIALWLLDRIPQCVQIQLWEGTKTSVQISR